MLCPYCGSKNSDQTGFCAVCGTKLAAQTAAVVEAPAVEMPVVEAPVVKTPMVEAPMMAQPEPVSPAPAVSTTIAVEIPPATAPAPKAPAKGKGKKKKELKGLDKYIAMLPRKYQRLINFGNWATLVMIILTVGFYVGRAFSPWISLEDHKVTVNEVVWTVFHPFGHDDPVELPRDYDGEANAIEGDFIPVSWEYDGTVAEFKANCAWLISACPEGMTAECTDGRFGK